LISKLLIANRGEVVCRIARTAHRLGISTVGVYSETDSTAMHLDYVDVAMHIGGAAPADSYLREEAILEAAKRSGADAIHPGYGFLSENADFAQAVIEAGLTWVGPKPRQIRLLGNKISAKNAAVEAGVPTARLVEVSPGKAPAGLSMPVLVKAAAGGGGRGMRIVRQHIDIAEAIEAAARESEAAFGDGSLFIEPYIERGRHIEVQIIADSFGTVLHLGDRECSIQRRNQKIIEEAPAPALDDELRHDLIEGALTLARHVGYEGAGTVEFMIGDDGTVNFLEVNTRLQVEHPVTEAITGLDLVELQLLVADGKRLPISQDEITFSGHAIEARVVAEDPQNEWLPDTGRIVSLDFGDAVRVDAGVSAGSEVSVDYDSLLAKVIAHAPTRRGAAALLQRSLRASTLAGVRTNLNLLIQVLDEPDFLSAQTTTKYLEEHPGLVDDALGEIEHRVLLAAASIAAESASRMTTATGFAPSGWRNLRTQGQRRAWLHDGEDHHVEYIVVDDASYEMKFGPWPQPLEDGSLPPDDRSIVKLRVLGRPDVIDGTYSIEMDGMRSAVEVTIDGAVHTSSAAGQASFSPIPIFAAPEAGRAGSGPNSPLPGTVIAVHVAAGDEVDEGQLLVVVEAMKMEHQIVSAGPAVVDEVLVGVGDRVGAGDLLVSLSALQD